MTGPTVSTERKLIYTLLHNFYLIRAERVQHEADCSIIPFRENLVERFFAEIIDHQTGKLRGIIE